MIEFYLIFFFLNLLQQSDLNLKGMSEDVESCILMVGLVDFLDRPGM